MSDQERIVKSGIIEIGIYPNHDLVVMELTNTGDTPPAVIQIPLTLEETARLGRMLTTQAAIGFAAFDETPPNTEEVNQ